MSELEAVDKALDRYNAELPSHSNPITNKIPTANQNEEIQTQSIQSVEMITPIVAAQVQGIPNVAAHGSQIPTHLLQAETEESQTLRNPRRRQVPQIRARRPSERIAKKNIKVQQ
ncbi:hypothetical protein Tco_0513460 [Tanacetum coccineum]